MLELEHTAGERCARLAAMTPFRFAIVTSIVCLASACVNSGDPADTSTSFSTFGDTGNGDGDGDGENETSDGMTGDGDGDPGDGDGDGDGDATCGDGMIGDGEECDLGPDNSDAGQCTTSCLIADCGDGLVYEGFEECDDGNPDNTDDCVEGCLIAQLRRWLHAGRHRDVRRRQRRRRRRMHGHLCARRVWRRRGAGRRAV